MSACRITDAQVDDEIRKRGGTLISPVPDKTPPTTLAGDFPQTVGQGSELMSRPSILISTAAVPRCQSACWETVSREYLDGNPVLDPGSHPAAGQAPIAGELNKRAVNGYVPDVSSANPPGRGPNGACDASKTGPSSYQDAPSFPDSQFDVGGSFRVYVLEQETCVRCLVPPSGYLGCATWYFVKVRHNDRPSTVRLVTTGTVGAPSSNFRAAIDAWNK